MNSQHNNSKMKISSLLFAFIVLWPSPTLAGLFGGCKDWCVEPYCSCTRTWMFSRNECADGYSGTQCQCPFSKTNIADKSFFIPDSLTGSLELTRGPSGEILAGTWSSAYEASADDVATFSSWLPNTNNDNENVWSLTKTAQGTRMFGTPDGIYIESADDSSFRFVLDNDGVHGKMVSAGDYTFAGTFAGLLLSSDEGETWTKVPDTCEEYNIPTGDVYKPPVVGSWCNEGVTSILFDASSNSIIAFFMGYGGAHRYRLDSNDDPTLEASWEALPTFQEDTSDNGDAVCGGGYCRIKDAIMFSGYLYVAINAQPLVRMDISSPEASWERVSISSEVDAQGVVALEMAGNTIFAATVDGLHSSQSGVGDWVQIAADACSSRSTPPLMQGGLVASIDESRLVVGTIFGPWVYQVEQ